MSGEVSTDDVRGLRTYVDEHLADNWTDWPGGYPGEAEAALIDAVMSIRARYGRPATTEREATGVYRAVRAYRQLRAPEEQLDDLRALAGIGVDELAKAVGWQVTGGNSKAGAVIEAAQRLSDIGVMSSAHVDITDKKQKGAYTGVVGLGGVTWEYLGMLLGQPGVKADRWVIAAVSDAVQRRVTVQDARRIVLATAEAIAKGPTELEHALWAYRRKPMSTSVLKEQ